ncbi:MAG: hypothetical protein E6X19_30580 [Hungatella hathewayi]|nr:hypothetical protein [Hungatella hathewayi]
MNKNKPDMNYKTPVPYGPATGKDDPGRQPVIDSTPYEGDRGPDHRQFKPGHVPGGPGHKDCEHE